MCRQLLGTLGAPGVLKRLKESGGVASVTEELQLSKLRLEV